MWLYRDPPVKNNKDARGWSFVVEDCTNPEDIIPIHDSWSEEFLEISMYPAQFTNQETLWIEEDTGLAFSMADLKRRFETA
jgi:hypothetical protein